MHPLRHGVTLMETAIGTLLVGGVLAATLQLVGPTVRSTALAGDRVIAAGIADVFLDEILAKPYADPTHQTGTIGLEPGETAGDRATFDDVDDYHGWFGPPQGPGGEPMGQIGAGWQVQVQVIFVTAADPVTPAVSDTGIKRVTVTVTRHGTEFSRRVGLRTRGFDESGRGS